METVLHAVGDTLWIERSSQILCQQGTLHVHARVVEEVAHDAVVEFEAIIDHRNDSLASRLPHLCHFSILYIPDPLLIPQIV